MHIKLISIEVSTKLSRLNAGKQKRHYFLIKSTYRFGQNDGTDRHIDRHIDQHIDRETDPFMYLCYKL